MKMYYNRCKKKLKRQKRLDRPNNISSGNKNLISNAKLRNKKEHKKDKQQTEKIKTAQVLNLITGKKCKKDSQPYSNKKLHNFKS